MIEYENLTLLNAPFFNEYKTSFEKTLKSGWYILGENVRQFENEFASYCGVLDCIGVASGLDALVLSIEVFGFEPGSEIIVPSNTYIATIIAIIRCGMQPVLVEPDILTYNIDPNRIEDAITSKTVAIIPVHLYGKACDMDAILTISNNYGLRIIEDCSQSHGAKQNGRIVGTFGDCNAFSFYPTKNLGALGDAGAITTNDKDIASRIRTLRNYGSNVKYHNEVIGFNSRLDELQAGFLMVKLKHLDEINMHKRKLASIYFEELSDAVVKPYVDQNFFDVYHIFNIRHKERDSLKQFLLGQGIKTDIHYPISPARQIAMQKKLNNYNYPIAEEIHSTTLSLPISFFHGLEDIRFVINKVNMYFS
jgi:dTDP-4-amino-4,6-dideoxygalactose transaminase